DHDSIRIFNHYVRPGGAEDAGKQATAEQQAEVNTVLAAYRAAHPGTARLDSIFNGADDDGSGSISVLEIAEKMASRKGAQGLTFDYSLDANGHPMNIYCRSDHYEYARYGIPIIFFTTGGHSDYHQVTDEPQYIDYDHMAKVVNYVDDLAMHVAALDHRPVVDQPKPDPHGRCQQ